ncbi:MAG: hypothetical protein ACPHOZ_04720 [Candidatus Puniceispirillaceae bacterium]
MVSPFFQGKGQQIFEKKAEIPINKAASCQLIKNNNAASLPIGQIAAMAKA